MDGFKLLEHIGLELDLPVISEWPGQWEWWRVGWQWRAAARPEGRPGSQLPQGALRSIVALTIGLATRLATRLASSSLARVSFSTCPLRHGRVQ